VMETQKKPRDLSLYGGHDPRHLPLYPADVAARFLLLPLSTLKTWVFGAVWYDRQAQRDRRFEPLITPPDPDKQMLSFVNLVEAHVLKSIRRKHNVQMVKVRDAVEHLKQTYETLHPLADVDLLASGSDLFVEELGHLLNITRGKQVAMGEILKAHLERIERNVVGTAAKLYPFVVSPVRVGTKLVVEDKTKLIAIDPFVSFGRPVITGTGIPSEAIAERFVGGDSIADLVEDFGRTVEEIEHAIRYQQAQTRIAA
jgi:uncharacterized protein (DUF433 family)